MGNVSYSAHISNGKSAITSKSKLLGVAKHNLRKYKSPEYSSDNILLLRGTEDLYQDVKNVYHQEFDEVIKEYNEKQKRADRKIDDYFSKILHDKKTHHQQELIVAVGCKDENTEEIFEMKKNILDEYMKGFQERNPNLKVYNAVMHLDEANPHLHINFVPVYESKRGLSKKIYCLINLHF